MRSGTPSAGGGPELVGVLRRVKGDKAGRSPKSIRPRGEDSRSPPVPFGAPQQPGALGQQGSEVSPKTVDNDSHWPHTVPAVSRMRACHISGLSPVEWLNGEACLGPPAVQKPSCALPCSSPPPFTSRLHATRRRQLPAFPASRLQSAESTMTGAEPPSPSFEQPSPSTDQPTPSTAQPSPWTEQPSPSFEQPSPGCHGGEKMAGMAGRDMLDMLAAMQPTSPRLLPRARAHRTVRSREQERKQREQNKFACFKCQKKKIKVPFPPLSSTAATRRALTASQTLPVQ
jgi:hypothetical protein